MNDATGGLTVAATGARAAEIRRKLSMFGHLPVSDLDVTGRSDPIA
jgi:hypothetical protein